MTIIASPNAEWLGNLPTSWSMSTVRALVEDINIRNYGSENENYLSLMANIGVILYADKGDVGNKKPEDLSKCKIVKIGDLVINSMNYGIGSYGISRYEGICSPVYLVLRTRPDVGDQNYVRRIFEIPQFQRLAQSFGNGILEHRRAIGWDTIKNLPVPMPPLATQRTIAAFLDRETAQIDDLIGKQERLIELLAEKRQAIITHTVTKGLDPNAPTKPSGIPWLGDVSASWPVRPLKAAGEISLGKMVQPSPKAETDFKAPYLRAANVQPNGVLALDDVKKMWFNESEVRSLDLRAGDVVVVEGGIGGFGRAAFVDQDLTGYGYQNSINRIRPYESTDGRFLTYLLLTARHFGYIHAYCTGVSMPHLTAEKLAAIKVPLPDHNIQTKISAHLDAKLAKLNVLSNKALAVIEILQERRSALITAAVTGKLAVHS